MGRQQFGGLPGLTSIGTVNHLFSTQQAIDILRKEITLSDKEYKALTQAVSKIDSLLDKDSISRAIVAKEFHIKEPEDLDTILYAARDEIQNTVNHGKVDPQLNKTAVSVLLITLYHNIKSAQRDDLENHV